MSKKEELTQNEVGAYPCRVCLRKHKANYYPVIKMINGLAYAQCSNPECSHFDPYEFIGITKQNAIRNWNDTMVHDTDNSCKKD